MPGLDGRRVHQTNPERVKRQPPGVRDQVGSFEQRIEHQFDYTAAVTEQPRRALRQPRSLQPEQLGRFAVSSPAVPQQVRAWVVWEDGVEELVAAYAVAWTKKAVRVRFGAPPHQHEVWVWAGGVERA
jgi:hypothetical protein